jgi:hypothetical protein
MSTLLDSARDALFSDGEIIVSMAGGTEIRFPVAENPRLARGFSEQLNHIEIPPPWFALARLERGSVDPRPAQETTGNLTDRLVARFLAFTTFQEGLVAFEVLTPNSAR